MDDQTTSRGADAAGSNRPVDSTIAGNRRWMILGLFIAGVAFATVLFNLDGFRRFGTHEVYAAEPARTMLRGGDWVVPEFGGLPRLRKPPLGYWVIAATGWLCGGVDEFSARLPAALSALGLAAVMGWWGWRWYGRVAGVGAAIVQLTSLYAVVFARKAEVDMLLCLLTTSALFLVAQQPADESRRGATLRWTGIYCLLSLAWLAKFHYGPVMVLAPAFVYQVVQRRFRRLWDFATPTALIVFAIGVFAWPAMLLARIPDAWQTWQNETIGRALGTLGKQPIWFYIPPLLWMTLPWTVHALTSVPASFRKAWPVDWSAKGWLRRVWNDGGDPRERFLWVWFSCVLLIITASANKHAHYLIAALPVFSLWSGQTIAWLSQRVAHQKRVLSWPAAGMLAIAALVGAAVVAGIGGHKWPSLQGSFVVLAIVIVATGLLVPPLLAARRELVAVYSAMACLIAGSILFNGWIFPVIDPQAGVERFARRIRRQVPVPNEVTVYKAKMNPVVFYIDTPLQRIETWSELERHLRSRERADVVVPRRELKDLHALGEVRIRAEMPIPRDRRVAQNKKLVLVEFTRRTSSQPTSSPPLRTAQAGHAAKDWSTGRN
jgi:4-amino-4-deoxy-L-arabinose transferase-like glycosyltransferase